MHTWKLLLFLSLTTLISHDRIHLYHMSIWMCFHELLKILVGSSVTTGSVNFKFRLFITRTVLYLSWQIDISDVKKAGINVIIKRFFAAHKNIPVTFINLMYRLPIPNKRCNDFVDSFQFKFIGKNAT